MRLFGVKAKYDPEKGISAKCGGCNWEETTLYVLADSQKEADGLYESGEAGLCGSCMSQLIVDGQYEIQDSH